MSNPSVLLCNPPSPSDDLADREAVYGMGALYESDTLPKRGIVGHPPISIRPPHTLAWCGAVLKKTGWKVKGLDAVAEELTNEACIARIAKYQPDIVVLLVSPRTAQRDLTFIHELRHHLPHSRLLLIGLAAHYLPSNLVNASDMVLTGEPEGAIDAACSHLLSKHHACGVLPAHALMPSMYNLRGNLLQLNHLPAPAWELFPIKRYSTMPILASRGCNNGCRYCPVPLTQGSRVRVRSAEQIADEMQRLYKRHNVNHFTFIDPLFAIDRVQTQALCETLIERNLSAHLSWECETRPEQLDLSLLKQMKRAGCRTIHLGLESVSPPTLIAMGRLPDEKAVQQYLSHIRDILSDCRTLSIECRLHAMAGLPGDRAGASATRAFMRAYSSNKVEITPLTPYPGTSIFPTNQIDRELALLQKKPAPKRVITKKSHVSRWWQAFSRVSSMLFAALG